MTEKISNAVSHTMTEFSNGLKDILEDNLVSVILFGSAVLGDFTPGKGDLDFVVVVRNDLSYSDCNKIFRFHDRLRTGEKGTLAAQLEGTYYPVATIENPKYNKAYGCYVGTGRKGWKQIDSNCNNMADYSIIRNYGVTCHGEDIIHRFYNPSRRELLEEIGNAFNLNIETASTLNDPDYAVSMLTWGPRALCYTMTGKIYSKSRAAEWFVSRFPDTEWSPILDNTKKLRYPLTPGEMEALDPFITKNIKDFLIHLREIFYARKN